MAPSGRNWPKLCMEGTNGIKFPGKKNGSHLASDLRFSYSSLCQRFNKMSTSGPNGPRFCMEGINGIRCQGKNKPKGLKVAKEEQMAQWLIGLMVNRLDGL